MKKLLHTLLIAFKSFVLGIFYLFFKLYLWFIIHHKKILKRSADVFEKAGVGSLLIGLFHKDEFILLPICIGLGSLILSYFIDNLDLWREDDSLGNLWFSNVSLWCSCAGTGITQTQS